MQRYLEKAIKNDLREKMVFLGGPRQVGKTEVGFHLLNGSESHPGYLSWDDFQTRTQLLAGQLPPEKLIVLDEIHKYQHWRNLVKGFYDKNKSSKSFLITGSARLDYYRHGGDSLQGRYHYHRLHPITITELKAFHDQDTLEQLLRFGGFPEPFLKSNTRHYNRWQKERAERVVTEDLINLEDVKKISQLSLLQSLLPTKVGSLLSINSLREDLSVAFETVDQWIHIFENLYYCFRIQPWGPNKLRSIKKEKKLYLWDWSLVQNQGARFENLVASHLLQYCHQREDREGVSMDLQFLRDNQKREINFVVLENQTPLFGVEVKMGEKKNQPPYRILLV